MKLAKNINSYHSSSSLLLQFILYEYFTVHKLLKLNRSFKKAIHNLAGSTLASMRFFSWTLDDSPIAKIKNYCAQLHHHRDVPKIERESVRKHSFELWELGLEGSELIEKKKSPKDLFTKIEKEASLLGKGLMRLIKNFSSDENVLYFILRHKELFDDTFGKGSTQKLIKKNKNIIIENYKKRQFDSLIPTIYEKLSRL